MSRSPGSSIGRARLTPRSSAASRNRKGLWVILRPGPVFLRRMGDGRLAVVAAERRRHPASHPRSALPRTGESVTSKKSAACSARCRSRNGGPILMVQVENEYGFLRQGRRIHGRTATGAARRRVSTCRCSPCNPQQHLKNGYRPDLFPVVNFGSRSGGRFQSAAATFFRKDR